MTALSATIDRRHRILTLVVCCMALFMTTLDSTILNVALPSLQRGLGSSESGLQWTVDSYVLVRASVLFLCGSLGDRFGRRRLFGLGIGVFVLSSACCGLAPSLDTLIGFRAVQGFGSALMTPASLAIITNTFTDRKSRAQAVGVWGAISGLSTAAGPVLGGVLVETLGWRSVFWVNVPIGLAVLIGTRRLSESRAEKPRPFDIPGQAAIGIALATVTYALISGPESGWSSAVVLVLLAVSVAAWFAFGMVEKRTRNPLVELHDLAQPALLGAILLAIMAFLALGGYLFFNTLYLQNVRGFSPVEAGLLTVPTTAMTMVLAPISGRITGTRGPRGPATMACLLIAGAMAVLVATIRPDTPMPILICGYVLLGAGMGLINTPITNAAMSSMPPGRAGVAAATTSTARQIGTNLGVALLGSVVFSTATAGGSHARLHGHAAVVFTDALRYGYTLAGVLALACCAVAMWAFRPGR
jgi:EmrB/QacA subfamily drug resistance transporter